jgi:hypothetical protein
MIVWLNEDRDRVASEQMGNGEADRPAHDERQYAIDNDLEFPNCENVLVHDQDRWFDKSETDDWDHVDGEFGLPQQSQRCLHPSTSDAHFFKKYQARIIHDWLTVGIQWLMRTKISMYGSYWQLVWSLRWLRDLLAC